MAAQTPETRSDPAHVASPYEPLFRDLPVAHHEVEVDGGTTHYWVYGPEDAATTILAVHGFRGDHHGLESLAAHLPEARTIVPDLPGFGISDPFTHPDGSAAPSDLDAYVRWLRAFHAALGLGHDTVVLGHSFGSIVTSAAVASGLDTRRLVLVNPIAAPALKGPRGVGTAVAVAYYQAGAALPSAAGLAILRNRGIVRAMSIAMLKSREPRLRRWVHDQHDRYFSAFANRRVVLEAFRASVTHDVSEFASRITVPTLMIAAERDDVTAVPAQRALADRLRDATLVVIPGVGHLVHYETPRAAADAIRSVLPELGAVTPDASDGVAAEGRGRPLRIGIDCRYVRLGRHDGISRFTAGIAAHLPTRNEHVLLVSDERQLASLPTGLPWELLPDPTAPGEPLVARVVNRLGLDAVWSPMQTMGSRGRHYALVLTLHDLIYYRHRTPPREFSPGLRLGWRLFHLTWWPQRMLLDGADGVVTVSRTTEALMREHRLTSRPITLAYNAADPVTPRDPDGPRTKDLVYMGSFMPYKNVTTLARAMALLPGWTLHCMSRISDADRSLLERLAPAGSIVFHDGASDEEYAAVLRTATALVSASHDEGFGIPLVEAMAMGTPVAVSDIPIFREIGGSAAEYFDPASAASVAAAVRRVERAWPAASRASVLQAAGFTWPASAEAVEQAVERAVRTRA